MGKAEANAVRPDAGLLDGIARGERKAAEIFFARHAPGAYRLALLAVGNAHDAEDAVQEAFLRVLRMASTFDASRAVRPWLARVVLNSARDQLRARGRRTHAQRAPENSGAVEQPEVKMERQELTIAARAALAALPEEHRLAVALRYAEGFTVDEAAEALGLPRSTVDRRARGGLDKLRRALGGLGASVPAAALAAALAQGSAPAAPASLAGKLDSLAARTGHVKGAAATATAKGGIAMKIVVAAVLAGAVAAGVATVGRGPAPLPAEKPPKFATPVSDPNARWVKETFAHVQGCGDPLDGPRKGMQANAQPGVGTYFEGAGDWYLRKYDPELDRYFTVSRGAAGYLDGPVSRARFNSSGYANGRSGGRSPDGRYQYFTEPSLNGILRVIDWEKREVKTILDKVGGSPGMTVDSKGKLYIVSYGGFQTVTPDGKVEKRNLEFAKGTQGYALSIVLDEVNGRLYAARRDTHVWYWDLKTGKYVAVLNSSTSKAPPRKKCSTGPFEGMNLHCPAGLVKWSGDSAVGFLYFGGGDDTSFYRLDLKKRYMLRFRPMPSDKNLFYFGEANGKVGAAIKGWCGPPRGWDANGNFYLGAWSGGSGWLYRYKRVK